MTPNDTTDFGFKVIPTSAKTEQVASVFHTVAKQYDLMNDLMSFGLHRLWKNIAIAKASLTKGQTVLDLAGGTGDLAQRLVKKVGKEGTVVLSDINQAMLAEGKKRSLDAGIIKEIQWIQTNAESLPYPNNIFDVAIMGFGLRNVTHKDKALQEMHRVLKPNGKIIILEFSHPTTPFLNKVYDAYSFTVLPLLGKLIAGNSESYQYLAESIRMHPNQETLKSMMNDTGFKRCEYQNLQGGIVALHMGYKQPCSA